MRQSLYPKYKLFGIWMFLVVVIPSSYAAERPWRSIEQSDLDGIWRQVGVVVLLPSQDRNAPWYSAKQFFRFPPGEFRHVLVNPDSEPERTTPNQIQLFMLEKGKATQTLTWHKRSIAWLKHPERPKQRIDFGLYLRDADTGPMGSKLKPRKGDLILVFYDYKDPNVAVYYRLLRKLS